MSGARSRSRGETRAPEVRDPSGAEASKGRAVTRPGSLTAVMVAAALGVLLTGCGDGGEVGAPQTAVERPAVTLLGEYNLLGKVTLIEFGIIGCELSEQGLTDMMQLDQYDAIPDLAFIRVEESSDPEEVDEYYARMSPGFPVHRDPDGSLARALQATVRPCFLLVDTIGRVRYRGGFPGEHLDEWAGVLMAERTPSREEVPLFGTFVLDAPTLLAGTRLPEVGSGAVRSLAGYAGEGGLMVVFVDISCPYSQQAIDEIPEVAKTLAWYKVATVLVNVDDAKEPVEDFYAGRTVGAPVVYDVTPSTRFRWHIDSVPTVILVGPAKRLAYNGPAVWKDVALGCEAALHLGSGAVAFQAEGTEYG